MLEIYQIHKSDDFSTELTKKEFINFLHTHLDHFGDTEENIEKAVDYNNKNAIKIYKKLGMKSNYMEMRYKKTDRLE